MTWTKCIVLAYISITRAGPFACLRLRTLRDGDGENSNRQSAAPEFDPRRSMRNVAQCKIAWMSLARASHWIRLRGCRSCGRWSRTTARCSKTQFAPGWYCWCGGEVEPYSFHFFSYSSEMGWVIVKMDGHLDMLSKGLGCSHWSPNVISAVIYSAIGDSHLVLIRTAHIMWNMMPLRA